MKRKFLSARPQLDGQYLGVKLQEVPEDGSPGGLVMLIVDTVGKVHGEYTGIKATVQYRDELIKLGRAAQDANRSEADKLLAEFGLSANPGQESQMVEAASKKKKETSGSPA